MTKPDQIYTTYIRSTPEKIWSAITNPEFTHQYWGNNNVSDWKKGSEWKHVPQGGEQVYVMGEVLESNPPKRLVLSWFEPGDKADVSTVTFEIEAIEDMSCLTITHGNFKAVSDMAAKVSGGWPRVISSMKSFLETGKALNIMACKKADKVA